MISAEFGGELLQRSIAVFDAAGWPVRKLASLKRNALATGRIISLNFRILHVVIGKLSGPCAARGLVADFSDPVWGLEMRQHSCPISTSILFWAKNVDRQPLIVHNVHLIGVPTMRITTTLAAAAAIAVTGAAASAGGLAPEVMEAPVVVVDTPMAPAGSINSGYVVLGLLAALVAASGSY